MSFPVSPGISTAEVDLTTSVPSVATSIGGFVGTFNWGPVNYVTPISNEVQLAATFQDPDNTTAESFFSCADFLSYANAMQIVRAQGTGMLNATGASSNVAFEIDNPNVYFQNYYPTVQANNNYCARFPGALGNSIKVVTFANTAAFNAVKANPSDPNYVFANYFSWAPNTTPYVTQKTNGAVTGDELHIAVIDSGGLFTGTANAVLEIYQGLSRLSDAQDAYGNNNYYREVLFTDSNYIYSLGVPCANVQGWGNTTSQQVAAGVGFGNDILANTAQFSNGNNGVVTSANVVTGWGLLADPTFVQVNLLITGTSNTTVQNYVIQDVAQVRKDCVAFASAPLSADQSTGGIAPVQAVAQWGSNVAYSSYAVLDTGYYYRYDKYNDLYRYVPLNGSIAGLCARTDLTNAPWWSPAGPQRGVLNNVVKLAYNPGLPDRNTLYQAGINPVVTFPSQGTMLYGDKTHLNYISAFDRINVRRLFIVVEQQISLAAQNEMFQFNDTFTRAQFVALINPYLRTVQGQRGITAFQVVCDTTNNTPAVIDADQFVGDIYIQPARSINFILLNFVAVATGVSFSEVIGQAGNA